MELYLVTYVRHNALTNGLAYKVEKATPDINEAKQKYHALCAEFFYKPEFDAVSVFITDFFGNRIDSDWQKSEPQPIPEPEIEAEA